MAHNTLHDCTCISPEEADPIPIALCSAPTAHITTSPAIALLCLGQTPQAVQPSALLIHITVGVPSTIRSHKPSEPPTDCKAIPQKPSEGEYALPGFLLCGLDGPVQLPAQRCSQRWGHCIADLPVPVVNVAAELEVVREALQWREAAQRATVVMSDL